MHVIGMKGSGHIVLIDELDYSIDLIGTTEFITGYRIKETYGLEGFDKNQTMDKVNLCKYMSDHYYNFVNDCSTIEKKMGMLNCVIVLGYNKHRDLYEVCYVDANEIQDVRYENIRVDIISSSQFQKLLKSSWTVSNLDIGNRYPDIIDLEDKLTDIRGESESAKLIHKMKLLGVNEIGLSYRNKEPHSSNGNHVYLIENKSRTYGKNVIVQDRFEVENSDNERISYITIMRGIQIADINLNDMIDGGDIKYNHLRIRSISTVISKIMIKCLSDTDITFHMNGSDPRYVTLDFDVKESRIHRLDNLMSGLPYAKIDLGGLHTRELYSAEEMMVCMPFSRYVDLRGLDFTHVTNTKRMFQKSAIETIEGISDINLVNILSANYMFNRCNQLREIDLSNVRIKDGASASGMFRLCTKLESVNLRGFNLENASVVMGIFKKCRRLTKLKLPIGLDKSRIYWPKYLYEELCELPDQDDEYTNEILTKYC